MSRPLYNSGFEGDEFSIYAQDGFEEVLESDVASDIEIYEKTISAEPVLARAVIGGTTGDTYNNSTIRQFMCRIGTLRCGQYIKAGDQFWIICGLPDNNKMYEKAVAWACKYSIKFISPISGNVVEYPVYDINSTQYGSGETPKSYMTIGTSQHLVYIPYNEETVVLDSGFRFLIDKNHDNPTVYRLAQVDTESYSCGENDGLIQWTIVESQFDPETDNKELMVADYYGKSKYSVADADADTETGFQIDISPEINGRYVVFGEEIKAEISFSKDGSIIDAFPLSISIIDGEEYGNLIDIGESYFVLRALNNREYIGHEITVHIENTENAVSEDVVFTIKGWY